MRLTIKALYVLLVILNLLDMGTTHIGLQLERKNHILVETSPAALWWWERFGTPSMTLLRIGLLILMGVLIAVTLKVAVGTGEIEIATSVMWIILFASSMFFLVVVTRNIELIIKLFRV